MTTNYSSLLNLKFRYNRDDGSGMAVAAIHLLSGFVAIDNSLKVGCDCQISYHNAQIISVS